MDIQKSVVWIGDTGFDGGGSATLGYYFKRVLNIPVFFKGTQEINGIQSYSNYQELLAKLSEIKPKIVLFMPDFITTSGPQKLIPFFNCLKLLKEKFNSKNILIDCTRKGVLYKKDAEDILEEMKFVIGDTVDSIWSINNISHKKWNFIPNHKTIDLNLFSFTEGKTLTNREDTIGYVSRFSLFKGVGRLFQTGEKHLLKNKVNYPLIHIGNDHNAKTFKEKGTVSGPVGIQTFFCHSMKDKSPRQAFSMKFSLNEDIEKDKYNVYPRYEITDRESVYSKLGIAICPTLSRVGNTRDKLYIEKNSQYWKLALEYVNCEMIAYGIPVMFSKDFCEVYDKKMLEAFPELIYTTLDEALEKAQHFYQEFQAVAPAQQKWLQNKLAEITQNVKNALMEELEKE